MDIWEKLYTQAKKEYYPEDVTSFVYAHHVVCALESADGTIYTGFGIEALAAQLNALFALYTFVVRLKETYRNAR